MARRACRLALVQTGPASPRRSENVERNLKLLDRLKGRSDFVLFPELSTTKYWVAGRFDPRRFADAEPLDGPTVAAFAKKAREISSYVLLPFYEKGAVEGEYFSSVVLLSPTGRVVEGVMPDGRRVKAYRKNHLSNERFRDLVIDEVSYMRPGTGFPVFPTKHGKVGVLVCRDRWFPESWRMLGLGGAELVFVPTASGGSLKDLFIPSMRTWCRESQVFGAIANKVGRETAGGRSTDYFGLSCVVGPDASVVRACGERLPEVMLTRVDLGQVSEVRRLLPNYRDRRPELYAQISQPR